MGSEPLRVARFPGICEIANVRFGSAADIGVIGPRVRWCGKTGRRFWADTPDYLGESDANSGSRCVESILGPAASNAGSEPVIWSYPTCLNQ